MGTAQNFEACYMLAILFKLKSSHPQTLVRVYSMFIPLHASSLDATEPRALARESGPHDNSSNCGAIAIRTIRIASPLRCSRNWRQAFRGDATRGNSKRGSTDGRLNSLLQVAGGKKERAERKVRQRRRLPLQFKRRGFKQL